MSSPQIDRQEACFQVMVGCACQGVRRSARALTRAYDRALSPAGIKATQFPILVALQLHGAAPLGQLAEALDMDRTTLTRNLGPLKDNGWVQTEPGSDRRVRLLALTPQGRKVLDQALELWRSAQESVTESFGAERLSILLGELSELSRSAAPG